MDRREKTIKKIEDNFVSLVLAESFSKVTIKQISEKSDINRKTFYTYFLDKFDLAEQMGKSVLEEYNILVTERFEENRVDLNGLLHTFLSDSGDIDRVGCLLSIHTDEYDFESEFQETIISAMRAHTQITDELEMTLIANFAITTLKYYAKTKEQFSAQRQSDIIADFQKIITRG